MEGRWRGGARDEDFEEAVEGVEGVLGDLLVTVSCCFIPRMLKHTLCQASNSTGNHGPLYRITQNTMVTRIGYVTTVE